MSLGDQTQQVTQTVVISWVSIGIIVSPTLTNDVVMSICSSIQRNCQQIGSMLVQRP